MKQKLIIELSEQATKEYLNKALEIQEQSAEINCMFPGVVLQIDILPPIEEVAYIKQNNELIELGEVNVKLVKFQQP